LSNWRGCVEYKPFQWVTGANKMSKEQRNKKDVKKKAVMTPKEKKSR
jgi:hypothetical protein